MMVPAPNITATDPVDEWRFGEQEPCGQPGPRILYFVSMFPCWSETFIVREIHSLLRLGADVRIISLRHAAVPFIQSDAAKLLGRVLYPRPWYRALVGLCERLISQPLITVRHPARIIMRLWRNPLVLAKSLVAWFRTVGLLAEIEAFSPDHVHAHWATYATTAAMAAADHLGEAFSFTAHAHDIFLNDQLMAEKLTAASFVATISEFNRDYLSRRYPEATSTRIEIIHCGVPRHDAMPRARASPANLIVSVGRLDEVKGFPVLLQACNRLKRQGVHLQCHIIGDGPQRDVLRAEIERLELEDCVELLGALPSQDIEHELAGADIFVLASQCSRQGNMDGIPVALMEAMASGVPVVSTAVSGIPELIEDGRTGLLVPACDPVALADAIRRMLEDETLCRRCVACAARKVRQEFDAETEASRLLHLIRSLLGGLHAQKIADHHR
jgi:colanic acid/amylovoran biosynthesis glycosyltransferase